MRTFPATVSSIRQAIGPATPAIGGGITTTSTTTVVRRVVRE
ncbi:hypothetical protein [Tahibacter amnicola]|uniref:Uncharacterized protein n=1 Tax=Tahibacter amnicola TaxID=2976241 RepID=A0ABY6BIF1_9GAMM|nr:hypothetical protein [Tahibacter amnicola]UXI69798.1 hypothetical protein N4264_09270 [Tahibacter amnicola]